MDQNIFHSNHTWLWLLIFGAIAIFFSGLLYFKERNLSGPNWLKYSLWGIRFSILFIILLLFIEPFLVQNKVSLEKPGILILSDNSRSMLQHDDSVEVKTLPSKIANLTQALKENFNVYSHSFSDGLDDSLNLQFKGVSTDIYRALYTVKQQYYQEPIKGALIISDGIINTGYDPTFIAEQFGFPLFTVGVGDSIQYPDLIIEDLRFNEISFLGNKFPVSLSVNARSLKGDKALLELKNSKGEIVFTKKIDIVSENFSKRISFNVSSEQIGLQYYSLNIRSNSKERNTSNNSEYFGIEVIDSRKKMLMLTDGPHPDISAIMEVLEDNNDLEIVLSKMDEPLESFDLDQFDLVWIYQPSSSNLDNWLTSIRKLKIPYLIHLGLQSDLSLVNKYIPSVKIKSRSNVVEDFGFTYNTDFSFFKMPQKEVKFFATCPPLRFPLASIQFGEGNSVLAFQNVNGMDTENPLISFSSDNDIKTAWLFGEGIWKWKMNDFRQNESFEHFSSLMDKVVQYLSVKKDRRRLRVKIPKKIVGNSPVMFLASFYNESYELDNAPELKMELSDENGKSYKLQFNRSGDRYSLKFSGIPAGKYDYKVMAETEQNFSQNGSLLIIQNDIELLETKSNFSKLNELASLNEGAFYFLSDWERLEKELLELESPKISYHEQEKTPLQEMPVLLYSLIGLLFVEWFVRKYSGVL